MKQNITKQKKTVTTLYVDATKLKFLGKQIYPTANNKIVNIYVMGEITRAESTRFVLRLRLIIENDIDYN